MRAIGILIFEVAVAVFGVATLVVISFSVVQLDPARALLGPNAPEEAVQELRTEYGLNEPFPVRYAIAMGKMARGDFGHSFHYNRPALDIVVELVPYTMARAAGALAVGFFGGVLLAWWSLGLGVDKLLRPVFSVLQSIPSFCILLIVLWTVAALAHHTPLRSPWLYEGLGILCSSLYTMGAVGLYVLERLASTDGPPRHVEFLILMNAPRSRVRRALLGDAMPGALAILVNALAVALTAVIFSELIYGLRGFGVVFIRACERGDMSIAMAGTVVLCVFLILAQRIGDRVVRRLDPRLASA